MNAPVQKVPGSDLVIKPDGKIILRNVVLSYPNLFEPYVSRTAKPGDKPKYSAKFYLSKATQKQEIQALAVHLKKLAMESFKSGIAAKDYFLRNGADSGKEEQANFFTVSSSEKIRPVVYDRNKAILSREDEDEKMYAGVIVNAQIMPWVQKNDFGKKINANLLSVQFVKHGERLGRAPVETASDFEDISSEFGDDAPMDDAFDDDIPF